MKKDLILVSKSPRRFFLLKRAGLNFEVRESSIKEESLRFFDEEKLKKISRTKALSISNSASKDSILISADTVVVYKGKCLGKPKDSEEAYLMLKNLSNNTHSVYTAITVFNNETKEEITEILETKVQFRKLSREDIERYIDNFNPLDKAGSYGIQDFIKEEDIENPPQKSFIQKIEGDYENVMGISTKLLLNMLNKI